MELLKDLSEAAYKYVGFRMRCNFQTYEERVEQDSYRTSAHNRYMDTLNIFLRYEKSLKREIPDITGLDRKDLGDMAGWLVSDLAKRQR